MIYNFITSKDLKSFSSKKNKDKPLSVSESQPIIDSVCKETSSSDKLDEEYKVNSNNIQNNSIPDNKEVHQLRNSDTDFSSRSYAGDTRVNDSPLEESGYRKLDFDSAAELVAFYDKNLNDSNVLLHPWQLQVNEFLGKAKPTQQLPLKFVLCACNGSGKDAFVIAPFAVWFCLTKIQGRCIITSSSGVQLTSQTEHYISNLCRKVNELHGTEIFKIRQRYIRCRLSGSEIRLFATDEEGKAEGYHPIEPNAEMAIIINEGKSVAIEIYRALRRCTGYNYWIEVSTPGAPHGDFFTHFTNWSDSRRVNTFECPHLSPTEREADKQELGEHSALYRSKHLALFTSVDGNSIIPVEVIERVKELSKDNHIKIAYQDWPLRVGIDLAAGGDENAIVVTRGNIIYKRLYFREKDTTITARRIDSFLLQELNLPKNYALIYADDGGIGRGTIDQLNSNYGWSIARVNNQWASSNKTQYLNRGAENWYRIKRILEESLWHFTSDDLHDDKFLEQLSTRYYKQASTSGKIALESKAEAKSNGRPSPDRADAFILSLTGLSISDFLVADKNMINVINKNLRQIGQPTEDWFDETVTYNQYEKKQNRMMGRSEGRFDGRISTLVARKQSKSFYER